MKTLLTIMLCLTLFNESLFVEGKNFKGYIFDDEHFVLVSVVNQAKRYTPTKDDVILTEKILAKKIECSNSQLLNQSSGCPKIHKNLKKYFRQYVGYIDKEGNHIIWVNFIWNNKISQDKLQKEIIQVNDECSYFWNIKINVEKKLLSNLNINGYG